MTVPIKHSGNLRPAWNPGQSGNPTGIGGPVRRAISIAKAASPEAVRKLIALTDVARGRDGGDTSTNARKINGHRRPRRLRTWR